MKEDKTPQWEKEFEDMFPFELETNIAIREDIKGGYHERIDVRDDVKAFIKSTLEEVKKNFTIDENTSDGYHTFKELYEFRKVYNAALFNEWATQGKFNVHKSKKHSDGEDCFGGGWFIVMATLPSGQISNHYELEDWDLFQCEEREKAEEWDGHTAQDVLERLKAQLRKEFL